MKVIVFVFVLWACFFSMYSTSPEPVEPESELNKVVPERTNPSSAVTPNDDSSYYALMSGIVYEATYNHNKLMNKVASADHVGARKILQRNRDLYQRLYKVKEMSAGATPKTQAYEFLNCLNFADGLVVDGLEIGADLHRYDQLTDHCLLHREKFEKAIEGHYPFQVSRD
jgi:hypothetical protein